MAKKLIMSRTNDYNQISQTSNGVKIESSWKAALKDEFGRDYFKELREFVKGEYQHAIVYPPPKNIFRAFELCPVGSVKVVILGQDPYHGTGQANGLCFAVNEGVPLPPSLQNIFKELESDLGESVENKKGDRAQSEEVLRPAGRTGDRAQSEKVLRPAGRRGDLERWARQGVLLLNATLTVRAGSAGSHQGKGWEEFSDAVIRKLSDEREHLVFILWGNYAKAKGAHIDRSKHLVIESAHPSPFSAANGFFGSKPFSKTNEYLVTHNKRPIDWL
ncbi:MAG: Uracil-DNA glycosylase [Parcubacteria group bacterium GW2011_GWA2_51_10]|nr:MAG: Uracil-DNA glycosylase [Parcubacteria group bacterium GW2011_GWA2_51_10]